MVSFLRWKRGCRGEPKFFHQGPAAYRDTGVKMLLFQAAHFHCSVRKKKNPLILLGLQEHGKYFVQLKQWCFPQGLLGKQRKTLKGLAGHFYV